MGCLPNPRSSPSSFASPMVSGIFSSEIVREERGTVDGEGRMDALFSLVLEIPSPCFVVLNSSCSCSGVFVCSCGVCRFGSSQDSGLCDVTAQENKTQKSPKTNRTRYNAKRQTRTTHPFSTPHTTQPPHDPVRQFRSLRTGSDPENTDEKGNEKI